MADAPVVVGAAEVVVPKLKAPLEGTGKVDFDELPTENSVLVVVAVVVGGAKFS